MANHLGIPDEIFNTLPPQFQDPDLDHAAPGPFGGTMGDALQQAIKNRIEEHAEAIVSAAPKAQIPQGPEGSKFVATGPALREQMNKTVEACAAQVQKVLDLHGCTMIAEPGITQDGRITARIQIRVALGPQGPPG